MKPVRLTKRFAVMECHSQDPYNPHPPFPQWSRYNVYPHSFWGSMSRKVIQRKYFMPTLENEYLRLTVAPDIGGRVWDLYDKIGRRHMANYNVGVRSYNAGFGLNYTTGGLEVNYPLAHSPTTHCRREVSFRRESDGAAAIVISEYERIWRTRWSLTWRLSPGCAYLEQRVRIYNRTPLETRYMYWSNCGFVLRPNTQYIFPEGDAALHGHELTGFSWPRWRHRDMSLFKEIPPEPIGLYFLNAREPYFGYYDHDDRSGLVHYSDLAALCGKKNWTWGTNERLMRQYRRTHHSSNEVFGEVQAGRIVIQEHLDRVPPDTEMEWSERWFPVRGTGAFNGAGPGAALRAEVVESGERRSRLKLSIMANCSAPRTRLLVASDGAEPVEESVDLDPTAAVERIITVKGRIGPQQHTRIMLTDRDGKILATCRLKAANLRDCWKEVIEVQEEVKPVGVEELFRAAEIKARDWGNHDLKPVYEKVVAQDAGFSPARRELGKLALGQGCYADAAEQLRLARERDPDCLENRYFHGLALLGAGRIEDARQSLEMSCRSDWEMRSLARLAEMRLREKDYPHALEHLDRVAAVHPRLTRCRAFRAFSLRKLGRRGEALAEIIEARRIDGQDPLLQYEEMLIQGGDAARLPARAVKPLVAQVRESEWPLLEAALDYFDIGAFEESETVLQTIPGAGALVHFLLANVQSRLGRKNAVTTLRKACRCDPAYQHAWQQEFIEVLSWARKTFPKNPRPAWHLGSLFMARRRTEEGVALWKEAEKLGETHALFFAGLGYYEKGVAKDLACALHYFRKADAVSGGDLYIKHEIYGLLVALKRGKEAREYLEGQSQALRESPQIAHDLLSGYLSENRFADFDALCAQVDFAPNWQIPGPHQLWTTRRMQEAHLLARQGRLQQALDILLDTKPVPAHLGETTWTANDRRLYHIGCLCEKLGRTEDAARHWEAALAIPHYTGYETAYLFTEWSQRYFQALCLQKLGRRSEAIAFFDAMEQVAQNPALPADARRALLDMVERGRFAGDDEKDPAVAQLITVQTRAEL